VKVAQLGVSVMLLLVCVFGCGTALRDDMKVDCTKQHASQVAKVYFVENVRDHRLYDLDHPFFAEDDMGLVVMYGRKVPTGQLGGGSPAVLLDLKTCTPIEMLKTQ
jgi:hypothetical protein